MNTNLLLEITTAIMVFISLLFAFFLLTVKSKNKTVNILMALYLIIKAIDTSSFFYHSYINVHPTIEMLRIHIGSFSQKPLPYLFVLSVIYSDFKLKVKHLLHTIPLLLNTIVLFPRFYLSSISSKIDFFRDYSHTPEGVFFIVSAHLQNVIYIIGIFILLVKYRKLVLENYSIFNRSNYKWLFQMNVILSILFIVAIIKNIYKYYGDGEYMTLFRLYVAIALLLFTCWLVLKALYAPTVFKGIDSKLQLVSTFINNNENSSREKNEVSALAKQITEIKSYMIQQEPYLDSDLTITDLANQLAMNTQELSLVINHHIHLNFYDFISEYRIEKAKEILITPEYKNFTILEILYKVGFNSKSSFNTNFKKTTGFTPTEYRNKHL
jgi:AraC-like DNA-binding protein